MLVLSRKVGERIVIDGEISVVVVEVRGDRIKLGVTAPPAVSIHREELLARIEKKERDAARVGDGPTCFVDCG